MESVEAGEQIPRSTQEAHIQRFEMEPTDLKKIQTEEENLQTAANDKVLTEAPKEASGFIGLQDKDSGRKHIVEYSTNKQLDEKKDSDGSCLQQVGPSDLGSSNLLVPQVEPTIQSLLMTAENIKILETYVDKVPTSPFNVPPPRFIPPKYETILDPNQKPQRFNGWNKYSRGRYPRISNNRYDYNNVKTSSVNRTNGWSEYGGEDGYFNVREQYNDFDTNMKYQQGCSYEHSWNYKNAYGKNIDTGKMNNSGVYNGGNNYDYEYEQRYDYIPPNSYGEGSGYPKYGASGGLIKYYGNAPYLNFCNATKSNNRKKYTRGGKKDLGNRQVKNTEHLYGDGPYIRGKGFVARQQSNARMLYHGAQSGNSFAGSYQNFSGNLLSNVYEFENTDTESLIPPAPYISNSGGSLLDIEQYTYGLAHLSMDPIQFTPAERAEVLRNRVAKQIRIYESVVGEKCKSNTDNFRDPVQYKAHLAMQTAQKKLQPLMDLKEIGELGDNELKEILETYEHALNKFNIYKSYDSK